MQSKYCLCGYKLEPEWSYCPDCGEPCGSGAPYEKPVFADTPYGNINRKTVEWVEAQILENVKPIDLLKRFGGTNNE